MKAFYGLLFPSSFAMRSLGGSATAYRRRWDLEGFGEDTTAPTHDLIDFAHCLI
jgi:hypothetical protein